MRTALIVFLSLALIGLVEGAVQLYRFVSGRRVNELRRRLQGAVGPAPIDSQLLRQGRFASAPALDAWLAEHRWARRLEHLLEQADSRMTVVQLCGSSLLGAAPGVLSAFWLGPLAGVILAAGLALLPCALLLAARERRSRKLSQQLPDALDMMARSLRAGHALSAAFELASTEMPEPISVEFARAFEEQRLGMPLERVVLEMAARAPKNGDLKIFAVSAVIQRETGGNLAEILEGISNTIRERYRLFGKVRALTSEARSSAWFVSLSPLALWLFLGFTQPQYERLLLTAGLGRTILTLGVITWVLGVVWFVRLTRFRY